MTQSSNPDFGEDKLEPNESVNAVFERLVSDGPANGVTISRLSPDQFLLTLGDEVAIVTLAPEYHSIRIDGPEVLARRDIQPGSKAAGFNYKGQFDRFDNIPMTLLAGRSIEYSGTVIREPATGRFEPQPVSDLGRFIYSRTVTYGWHQSLTKQNSRVLLIAGSIAAIVIPAMFVLVIGFVLVIWFMYSH
ncbi:hypothetical protein [Gordonia sp. (in: high G+C Gram-positive bacteria)]|uniref:hypothetical protein n=1 Tax=Gordonia sp. (in: high G+C Gram-positive bacteria) TaxID=84139 RepID=UPI0039E5DB89